jgi:hypothetical protein
MLSLFSRYLFRPNATIYPAGETTEGENGKLKIIWSNVDILEVAMARSVGYAN